MNDTFRQGLCGACGIYDINQYFSVKDNFITYNDKFITLREVLADALDFHVNIDRIIAERCIKSIDFKF